jgi:hypothetical protein
MSQKQWTAVDAYLTDLLVPPDPALDAVLEASAVAGLPRRPWAARATTVSRSRSSPGARV